MSIKSRILFGFLLSIMISAGGIIAITAWEMSSSAKKEYYKNSQMQLSLVDQYLTSFFDEYLRISSFLAKIPDLVDSDNFFLDYSDPSKEVLYDMSNLDPRAQTIIMTWRQMKSSNPYISEIFTGYPNKSYGSSFATGPSPGFNSSIRPWYVAVTNSSEPSIIGNAYQSQTGEAVVAVAHKILSNSGELVGALGIDISLKTLSLLVNTLNFGETGFFVLMEDSGRILGNPKYPDDNFKMIGELPETAWQEMFNSNESTMSLTINGTEMFVSSLRSETGFRIFSIVAAEEIYSTMYAMLWSMSLLTLVCIVLVFGLALWFVRSIFSPLNLLIEGANKLATGDFNAIPAPRFFYGEFLTLRGAMNHVALQLKEKLGFAESIMHSIAMPYVIADTNGNAIYINKQFIEYWGLNNDLKEYLGKSMYDIFNLGATNKNFLRNTIENGEPKNQVPISFSNLKGDKKYMQITTTPLRALDGTLLGGSVLISDMTDAHEQQSRIMALNEQIISSTKSAQVISKNQNQTFSALVDQLQLTAQDASEQELASSETTVELDIMIEKLTELANRASQTAESAQETRREALEGKDIVQKTKVCISKMAKQADDVEKGMQTLRDEAESINRIVDLIKDVADQTNLLALNAAIEAARAGEAGRGFAVVADEVRKLAEKTMQATIEVNNSVAALQANMNSSIEHMTQTVELIHLSDNLAGQSEVSLTRIVTIAEHSTEEASNMADATLQQTDAGNKVASSMRDIKERASQTVADMQDSEHFVESLTASALNLKALMETVGTERRYEKRIPFETPIYISIQSKEGKKYEARMIDINTSGMCIEIPSSNELNLNASYSVYIDKKEVLVTNMIKGLSLSLKWRDTSLCGIQFSSALGMNLEEIERHLAKYLKTD